MIRLGLIGCGEHAEAGHAIPLARYKKEHPGDIGLTAVCDLKIERAQLFCQKYGFANAFGDVDEMLIKAKLDGCIAVVPVDKISQVGIKLLKRSIPCVVEKPLGASIADVTALRDASRATRTPNMVSVNRRFMPFLNRAIDWTKTAGTVRYVRCTMTRHARSEPDFLGATAVHAVDALRHIAGDVAEASIRSMRRDDDVAPWYAIDLQFKRGVCGRIDVLPTAGMLEETYELIGEGFRSMVTCPFGPQRSWRAYCENRVVIEEVAQDMPEDILNGCYDEATEFIRSLEHKEFPRPSIENVFPSVELCLTMAGAAQRDAATPVSAKF
jgi:predicted dehydrogenase